MKIRLITKIAFFAALSLSAHSMTKHISDFDTDYGVSTNKDDLLCSDVQTICLNGPCYTLPARLVMAKRDFGFERLNHTGATYRQQDSNGPAACEVIEQLRSSYPNGLQVRVKESLDEIIQEFDGGICSGTLREEISMWLGGHEYANTTEISLGQVPCK